MPVFAVDGVLFETNNPTQVLSSKTDTPKPSAPNPVDIFNSEWHIVETEQRIVNIRGVLEVRRKSHISLSPNGPDIRDIQPQEFQTHLNRYEVALHNEAVTERHLAAKALKPKVKRGPLSPERKAKVLGNLKQNKSPQ